MILCVVTTFTHLCHSSSSQLIYHTAISELERNEKGGRQMTFPIVMLSKYAADDYICYRVICEK